MRYAVTSDIHVGHNKTPSAHIAKSFCDTILTDHNKNLDILFIAGDLSDKRIQLDSPQAHAYMQVVIRTLKYCQDNNIILRVLEGTRSHDWLQSAMVPKVNEYLGHPVNVKHINTLDIEYIPQLDKYILYIPDEWCHTQEELDKQITSKLNEHHIEQVDLAILHGQFIYQSKGLNTSAFSYDESYFLKLVKGYIHIGHYHTHTHFDRIIAQGSLERLSHGEEEDKGYIRVDNDTWSFIPNTQSYVYKTIKVTPKLTLQKLDKLIFATPPNSHIRLIIPKEHEFNQAFEDIRLRYKSYNLKKQSDLKASEDVSVTYIVQENLLTSCEHTPPTTSLYDTLITDVITRHVMTQQESAKFLAYSQVFKDTQAQPEPL